MRKLPFKVTARRLILIYLLLAAWWFFASDNLLSLVFTDPARVTQAQIVKFWLFAGVTALLLYVLAREALGPRAVQTAPEAPPAEPVPETLPGPLVPAAVLVLLALAIGGSWYSAFRDQGIQRRMERGRELATIAELEAGQLGDWVRQRMNDAEIVTLDPMLAAEAEAWFAHGSPDNPSRQRLLARLTALRKVYPYEEVILVDRLGGTRLAAGGSVSNFPPYDVSFVRETIEAGEVRLSKIHVQGNEPGAAPELDVAAPLTASAGHGPVGAIYFRIDPRRAIEAILGAARGVPDQHETLLMRREGDDVTYFGEQQLSSVSPPPMRLPLSRDPLASRVLVADREGLIESPDYRNIPVLAAARRVPGTDWFVVAKADAASLLRPERGKGLLMALLAAVFLAVAGSTTILWWHQQRSRETTRRLRGELEREAWKLKLAERDARLAALFDQAADAVFVHDRDGRIVEVNDQAARSLGYARNELIAMNIADIDLEAQPGRPDGPWQTLRPGEIATVTGLHRRKDGAMFPVEARLALIATEGGPYILASVRDVTTQRQAERSLNLAARVLESTGEAVVVTDTDNRIVSVNRAFTSITGYQPEEVIGRNPRILASGRHDRRFYERLWEALATNGHWRGEIWNRRKDGPVFPEWADISAVRDDRGAVTHYIAIFSDITERKAAEERISFLAQHDILTRLPNRALMHDRLSQAIVSAQRTRDQVAILFLDLDRFKNVNDSLGHRVGDLLLQAVAERLIHCVRRGDTVSRVGGDEFIVILPHIKDGAAAAQVARKALQSLSREYAIEGHALSITPSIGISVYPGDGEDIDTLVRNADAAMYETKQRGRGNFQFFTADMNTRALERIVLEGTLRRVLEQDRVILHYQPQVDTATGRVVAVEALLRWEDPQLQAVPTPRLIAVAEECGLMMALGERVLRRACAQCAEWDSAGVPQVPVAVNISPLQLRQPGFRERLKVILTDTALAASRLELEVTEGALLQDAEGTRAVTDELAAMGLGLVIDDFGSGYSSLSVLKGFRVQKLKIFQSLMRGVPGDIESAAMVNAILGLGASLGLHVLAEGVETPEQLSFLREHGCQEAQGYLFGRPLPPEEFTRWLQTQNKP